MAKTIVSNAILYDAAGNPIIDLTQDPAGMEVPPSGTLTNNGTITGGTVNPANLTVSSLLKSNAPPPSGGGAGAFFGYYGADPTQPVFWEQNTLVHLGKYNPGSTTQGQVPAGQLMSFVQISANGEVGTGSFNNTTNSGPTFRNLLDDGSGNMTVAGNFSTAKPVAKVAGEATTGTYGVLTTVAATTNTEITTTGGQSLWSWTPPANGLYTVKCYLRVTATTTVTVTVTYTDSGGSQTYTPDAVNAQSLSAGSYSMIDYSLEATSGGAISLSVNVNTANQVYATTALVGVS